MASRTLERQSLRQMKETFHELMTQKIRDADISDEKDIRETHVAVDRLWDRISRNMSSTFELIGSDPVEPLNRDLVERSNDLNKQIDIAAEKIRTLRESAPGFMENLMKENEASNIDENVLKVTQNTEHKEDAKRAKKKRRKLESCVTELSEMVGQIRENASLIASTTNETLGECKGTSNAVSEFSLRGASAAAPPSASSSAATTSANAATPRRTDKENL